MTTFHSLLAILLSGPARKNRHEVRKGIHSHHCRSATYARTIQAVANDPERFLARQQRSVPVDDLRRIVKELTGRGVAVKFHKEGLTFTGEDSPMANLLLSLLGSVAEFERSLIKERQLEGIAVAKAKGDVYKGRKPSLAPEQVAELRQRVAAGESKAELARQFKISRASVYNHLAAE